MRFDCESADIEVGNEIKRDSRFDKNGCLLLSSETCDECGIALFSQVNEKQLLRIITKSDRRRAVSKALFLLGRRAYASNELLSKLAPDFGTAAADFAVDRMIDYGYIDDADYARRLAENLINSKNISPRQAVYKMLQKGVERDLAQECVDALSPDETAQIRALIEAKYITKLKAPNGLQKVSAALARKGFSFDNIRRICEEFE